MRGRFVPIPPLAKRLPAKLEVSIENYKNTKGAVTNDVIDDKVKKQLKFLQNWYSTS